MEEANNKHFKVQLKHPISHLLTLRNQLITIMEIISILWIVLLLIKIWFFKIIEWASNQTTF